MSQDISQNNKRIAKNTLMLYLRMFFMMLISLYTSRINLDSLGVTDYGIYGAVGGIVAMFTIISGSLSVAIGRYFTYEIGTGNSKRLNLIFSTSVNIQIVMALLVMIIAEVAGVWFLNTQMNVPPERMSAANWVLQCSIITFMINLISVPYNSMIVAYERMSAFAYISIIEAVLKLLICYLLYISPVDKLVLWAVMLMLTSVLIRFIYASYCKRNFEAARYRRVIDRPLLKEMSKFIGWAFFGNGVVVLKDQGSNILLNIFCGPVVNAARGVAMSVNAAIYSLVSNFLMAVNPQITKSFSSGNREYMHSLIIRSGKFGFFILLLAFFPLWANIDELLGLWLVEVPAHTANFVVLILLYAMLDCYGNPLVNGVLAEGEIKRYEINLTVLYLTMFILCYICLKAGYAPEWVFILNIIFKALVICALLLQSHQRYDFPVLLFLKQAVLPSVFIFVCCTTFIKFVHLPIDNDLVRLVVSSFVILGFTTAMILMFGLTHNEYIFIIRQIKTKLHIKL